MRLGVYAGADEKLSKTLNKRMWVDAVMDQCLDKDIGHKTLIIKH